MNNIYSVLKRINSGERKNAWFSHNSLKETRRVKLHRKAFILFCLTSIAGALLNQFCTPARAQTEQQPTQKSTVKKQGAPEGGAKQEQQHSGAVAKNAAFDQVFHDMAKTGGANTCATTYASLGWALTQGTQFAVQTQTSEKDPNEHSVQGIAGMTFSDPKLYIGPAVGVVLATPTGSTCEGNMVRIVPFTQSCEAASALLPQGSTLQNPLGGIPIYTLTTGGQALLMPSGSGCVVISVLRAGH
jgi:cytoskeletal protein RodZ